MLNVHPLVVHFPIALLTLYALIECCRFKVLLKQSWLLPLKTVLLVIGTLGAFASLQSGEMIEDSFESVFGDLMEVHASFAAASTWVFAALALVYLIAWIVQEKIFVPKKSSSLQTPWSIVKAISSFVLKPFIIIPLAVIGLVLLTITGALGGAMVHGTDVDPLVKWIYNLFF